MSGLRARFPWLLLGVPWDTDPSLEHRLGEVSDCDVLPTPMMAIDSGPYQYFLHCIHGKMEARKGGVTCPRTHRQERSRSGTRDGQSVPEPKPHTPTPVFTLMRHYCPVSETQTSELSSACPSVWPDIVGCRLCALGGIRVCGNARNPLLMHEAETGACFITLVSY